LLADHSRDQQRKGAKKISGGEIAGFGGGIGAAGLLRFGPTIPSLW